MRGKILNFFNIRGLYSIIYKHERYVARISLVSGFLWDMFTMGAPDRLYENVILLGYFIIAAGGIIFLSTSFGLRKRVSDSLLAGIIQFSFGNLAGGLTVLYGKSGTFEGSALFFILLGAFLIGNEFLKNKYERVYFNISVWYFLLLTYLALVTPVLLNDFGDYVFFASGAASLTIAAGFLFVLRACDKDKISKWFGKAVVSIVTITVGFNALYFLNIIPPVPLALRSGGVYHAVLREGEFYRVLYEDPRWYEIFKDTSAVFHRERGEGVYCLSSIFAPVGLSVPVYHRWEFYDEELGKWVTALRITFPVVGGRDSGYRGYSIKTSVWEGRWRCSVETERGALIGRMTFQITPRETPILFAERIL